MTIRHALGSVVAAAALVLVPTSAFAYNGEAEALAVTDTNPAAGEPFQVIVDAGPDSDEATLTVTSEDPSVSDDAIDIAGTQSMTKATTAAGTAEFTVTLYVEGRYTLVGTDADGNRVGSATVVVGDGVAGDGSDVDQAGVGLPDTGSSSSTLVVGAAGALLLVGGGATLLYSRRRQHTA